ncbi:hypothetical protein [Nocardia sp. AG03]|uniref:hypothetical protein n=1 Tax=Nocardia sp. AG03 TaxID=3025312 RepID=UPI002418BB30|nr:hypothetical protein [Nocardia sp. AG03]
MSAPRQLIVVDAANVIGSRADGWWKDRAGAARRLLADLTELTARLPDTTDITVVLEGAAKPAADTPTPPRLKVLLAEGSGDDKIVEAVAAATTYPDITVVTADRELRTRVTAHNATPVGPSWLRNQLG